MKKFILIFAVCGLNLLFFQNFTSVSEEDKKNWGSQISDADNSAYDDFRAALKSSQDNLDDVKESWESEFEEKDDEYDKEVGAIVKKGESDDL